MKTYMLLNWIESIRIGNCSWFTVEEKAMFDFLLVNFFTFMVNYSWNFFSFNFCRKLINNRQKETKNKENQSAKNLIVSIRKMCVFCSQNVHSLSIQNSVPKFKSFFWWFFAAMNCFTNGSEFQFTRTIFSFSFMFGACLPQPVSIHASVQFIWFHSHVKTTKIKRREDARKNEEKKHAHIRLNEIWASNRSYRTESLSMPMIHTAQMRSHST